MPNEEQPNQSEQAPVIHWEVPSDIHMVGPTTEEFEKILPTEGWGDTEKFGLLPVAFDEALTNAIKYGNKDGLSPKVTIDITVEANTITVAMTDTGGGFVRDAVPKPAVQPGQIEISDHGRGILLMEEIFDTVAYSDQGRTVTMMKHRKLPAA